MVKRMRRRETQVRVTSNPEQSSPKQRNRETPPSHLPPCLRPPPPRVSLPRLWRSDTEEPIERGYGGYFIFSCFARFKQSQSEVLLFLCSSLAASGIVRDETAHGEEDGVFLLFCLSITCYIITCLKVLPFKLYHIELPPLPLRNST